MKGKFPIIILLSIALFFLASCASYHLSKPSLDEKSQKFLDYIRYIITPQEARIFRELPPEDRGEFIHDFWKRRDLTPETEENEFRSAYYTRLAVADKAFRAGIPGWMTDRGRIFILLGPPTDVIKKSMGDSSRDLSKDRRELSQDLLEEGTRTERPTEIWVYNQYPDYFSGPLRLVFVDYESNGNYVLTTDVEVKPFSMMSYQASDPNLLKYRLMGEIEKDEATPKIIPFLDYTASTGKVEKEKTGNYTVECSFAIPFSALAYRKEKNSYALDIEVGIEVRSVEEKSSYRESRETSRLLSAEELRKNIEQGSSLREGIRVPVSRGKNRIYFSVRDKIQGKRLRKLYELSIKR